MDIMLNGLQVKLNKYSNLIKVAGSLHLLVGPSVTNTGNSVKIALLCSLKMEAEPSRAVHHSIKNENASLALWAIFFSEFS